MAKGNLDLTSGNVYKTLLSFALPFMIANFIQALYGAVDMAVVGQYHGPEGTAALVRGVAAGIAQRGYTPVGFDAYATSKVLPGSGLSSSAACEVTIGVILNHLVCGDALDAVTIAQIGQYAENVFFGKPCGLMDQTASSVGGAVAIDFADTANPVVRPIQVDLAGYGYALCIIDSGADHADLTAEYAAIPQEMKAVAQYFGCEVLREVDESRIWAEMPGLRGFGPRTICGRLLRFGRRAHKDRCVLYVPRARAGSMSRLPGTREDRDIRSELHVGKKRYGDLDTKGLCSLCFPVYRGRMPPELG